MKSIAKLSKSFATVLSIAMLVLLAISSFSTVSAESSSNSYYLVEGNVTKVDTVTQFNGEKVDPSFSFDLGNVQYYVVQGLYDNEQDEYIYDYTITKPEGVKEQIVATPKSYNEDQNQMLLEVGTTNSLDELGQAEKDMDSASSSSDLMNKNNFGEIEPQANRNASFKTTWRDPVNLSVNSVDTKMSYTVSGGSVTSYTASDTRTWLTLTGWSENSHSLTHNFTSGGAEARTYSHMRNSKFCVGQPTTNVYYNTNNLYVGSAGKSGNVQTSANGGCSSWLSYSSVLN